MRNFHGYVTNNQRVTDKDGIYHFLDLEIYIPDLTRREPKSEPRTNPTAPTCDLNRWLFSDPTDDVVSLSYGIQMDSFWLVVKPYPSEK